MIARLRAARADFTFGYGKEVEKNFAVVEAKPRGERVQGALYQTMVYMGECSYISKSSSLSSRLRSFRSVGDDSSSAVVALKVMNSSRCFLDTCSDMLRQEVQYRERRRIAYT